MKMSAQYKTTILAFVLMIQGACASKPLIYSLGEPEVKVKSTAWADLTRDERETIKDKACITHLYRCDFNEKGEVTGIQSLDLSHTEFQELSADSLRTWTFQAGKAGRCFVDFVYTDDPVTRIFLLDEERANTVARKRMEARKTSLESKNKIRSIRRVLPDYPRYALEKGEIGTVRLNFDVNAEGIPEGVRIVESKPEGVFDRPALSALKRWRYKTLAEEPNKDRKNIEVAFYFNMQGGLGYDCNLGY
jgi:TonB family protein